MRKNATAVINAFKANKSTPRCRESGRGSPNNNGPGYRNQIWTCGQAIYSYEMKIAERLDDGSIWILPYADAPTATTRSHVRACQFLLCSEPLVQVATERVEALEREDKQAEVCVGSLRLRAVG